MTERDYEVGDVVWVRALVAVPTSRPPMRVVMDQVLKERETRSQQYSTPLPENVRTEADFKDPLDEAIVEAALQWDQTDHELGPDAGLAHEHKLVFLGAIRAKLDATKPKTAEQIVEWSLENNEREDIGSNLHVYIANNLRRAGLLKESDS